MMHHSKKFGDTATILGANHLVPSGWGALLASNLPTHEETVQGITRTKYGPCSPHIKASGEVWKIQPVSPTAEQSAAMTLNSGSLQLYVVSGSLTVVKDGSEFSVHAGQKVSFTPGSTFSLSSSSPETLIVARNEAATLSNATIEKSNHALTPPSSKEVEMLRHSLGINVSPKPSRPSNNFEHEISSRAYRSYRRSW